MITIQNVSSHSVDVAQPADAVVTLHPGEQGEIEVTDHAAQVLDAGLVVALTPEPAPDTASADSSKKPTKTAAADSAPAAAKETTK